HRYDNRGPGFQLLWDETQKLGAKFTATVTYAMEASGSYHHNLLVFLLGKTDRVWSFNPLLLRKERLGQLRKTKTDALDAQMIAEFARKDGREHPFSTVDPEQMRLRELCRVRFRLVRKASKAKQQLRRNLDILCPGLGPEFKDVASPSAMAVLKDVAQVTSLFQATVEDLEKLLKPFYQNPDRRHLKAVALQKHFEERVENGGLEEPLVFEVRFLLHQLELYEEQVRQVEGKIEREMERRKSLLTTVPGISLVTAAIVEGELGDPHRFPDERAVRAFAGLDPSVRQSGKFEGDRVRISKRGSPRLREGLYNAALPAMRVNPACREFYERLRAGGKHHKSALTAVAGKLLVQCWAVMRSGKSFEIPEKYRVAATTEKETTTFPSAPPSLEKGDASRPSSTSQESPQGPSREPKVVRK
ncbi:transposase IS116/IS110/IS902 family protein, partial [mine drainage metagenome]